MGRRLMQNAIRDLNMALLQSPFGPHRPVLEEGGCKIRVLFLLSASYLPGVSIYLSDAIFRLVGFCFDWV